MSSSSKLDPCWTSTKTRGTTPGLATRWAAPRRDVDRTSGAHRVVGAVEGDDAFAGHHEPVLGAVGVALITEATSGVDGQPLHLVVGLVGEDLEAAPGSSLARHLLILARAASTDRSRNGEGRLCEVRASWVRFGRWT